MPTDPRKEASRSARSKRKREIEALRRYTQEQRAKRAQAKPPVTIAEAARAYQLEAVRISKARLARQADPLGLSPDNIMTPWYVPEDDDDGPTAQRRAKANSIVESDPIKGSAGRRAHTVQDPIDANAEHFTDEERSAALELMQIATIAQSPAVVAAYDGVPMSRSSLRNGGVPDSHRAAYIKWVRITMTMHPNFRRVLDWFVGEVLSVAGLPRTMGQLGNEFSAYSAKGESAKGVGMGLLKGMLWRASEVMRRDIIEQDNRRMADGHARIERRRHG